MDWTRSRFCFSSAVQFHSACNRILNILLFCFYHISPHSGDFNFLIFLIFLLRTRQCNNYTESVGRNVGKNKKILTLNRE